MMVAQQLYEGLELGELGSLGLITYMRTDSTRIAQEALQDAIKVIGALFDNRHRPPQPRFYGKKKNAQDAHEAIRPSQVNLEFSPERVKHYLSEISIDSMSYMETFSGFTDGKCDFRFHQSDIEADSCIFRTTGSIIKFEGFLALYDETVEDNSDTMPSQNEKAS